MADIISNPSETNKYKTLKEAIIARIFDSAEKQFLKALTGMHLGVKKPSSLWCEMKALADDKITDGALKVNQG